MTTLLACGYHLSDASDAMQASLIAIASILFETNQPIGSKKPTSERFGEILSIWDKEKSKFMNMVFDVSILYLEANSSDLYQCIARCFNRWTYFLRTLPDIDTLLEPLERALAEVLIPSVTKRNCSPTERSLTATGEVGWTGVFKSGRERR